MTIYTIHPSIIAYEVSGRWYLTHITDDVETYIGSYPTDDVVMGWAAKMGY